MRAAIFVDRDTAALRIVTDPLPTILQGIPLQLRLAQVTVDRPGFTLNPTNCSTLYSTATIVSAQGTVATKYSRFQVDKCAALGFGPQMSMTIGARNHTAAGTTTPLTTTLRVGKGQANLHTVRVVLPTTLNARLGVVSRACTLAQFHAGHCTSRAKVGTAVAITPVLKDPLRGSAYFVRNPARPIPDLMVALRGQVSVDLTGKVTIPGGTHLATVFDTIPDVPVTSFTLRLVSGVNGAIGNIVDLCSARGRNARVSLGFRAQNGKLIQRAQPMDVKGCPAPNGKR